MKYLPDSCSLPKVLGKELSAWNYDISNSVCCSESVSTVGHLIVWYLVSQIVCNQFRQPRIGMFITETL